MKKINSIQKIKILIDKATLGDLSMEEFYNSWQDDWNNDEYLRVVYNNIENAVEHLPGKIFSKGVDYKKWHLSKSYRILLVDKSLLNEYNELNTVQLLKKRKELI